VDVEEHSGQMESYRRESDGWNQLAETRLENICLELNKNIDYSQRQAWVPVTIQTPLAGRPPGPATCRTKQNNSVAKGMVGGATEIQPPVPFLFKQRRPSPWNTCTTGAPSSSGHQRLRPVHQDRAISSTFLSDKSIRYRSIIIIKIDFQKVFFSINKLVTFESFG